MFIQSYDSCNAGEKKFTKQTLTRGGKILLAYLFIVYIFPLILNLLYDSSPIFRLPIHLTQILFLSILTISVSILAVLVARYTPTIIPRNKGPIKPLPKWFILIFSLVAIYIGYAMYKAGLLSWRYLISTSITDNSTILYASIVQMFIPVLGFWILITDHQFILSRSWPDMFLKFILLVGIIFSINGLGSMFITLIFVLVFTSPRSLLGLFFKNTVENKNTKGFFGYIGLLILLPFIILPIFLAGSYAKAGNFNLEDSVLAHAGLNYLVNRHSVHLSSLAASIEDGPNHTDLSIPFDTAMYRIKVISGLDANAQKPEVSSFSRLALLQFADFRNINPKGGSSPGFLASITMTLPLPLAILGVFLFTFILVKTCDFILCRQPPFSWIGAMAFAYIPFKLVTDSPLDLAIPGPTALLLLLIFLLSFRREKIT